MIYSDIEDLLFCPDACQYVCDGANYTEPFFTRVDGIFADAFLFYDTDGEEAFAYGGVVIDPKTKRVIKLLDDIELSLPAMLGDKSNIDEYEMLYEKIHGSILADELTEDARECVRKYLSFVKSKEYKYLHSVYTELFVEVMEWFEENAK